MSESPLYPWWVTSDADHPVNASLPVPEAPLMSESEPAPEMESDSRDYPFQSATSVVEAEPDMPDLTDIPSREPFPVPPHVTEAIQVAESPSVSAEDREHALEVLRTWDDTHKSIADAHPSTIPDDLIPAEYQAKTE